MKSKVYLILLFLLSLVFLVSCGEKEETPKEDVVTEEVIPSEEHKHTFSKKWSYDEKNHWHKATCDHDEISDKEAHVFDDGVIAMEPTSDSEGLMIYKCITCNYEKEEIIAPVKHEHQYTKYEFDKSSHWLVCGECGDKADSEKHKFREWEIVVDATENSTGLRQRRCEMCDYFEEEEIEQLPHVCNYEEIVYAPSCTDEGYTHYYCSCGNSYNDNFVNKLDHNYLEEVTKEPTCGEHGIVTFTCEYCNDSYDGMLAMTEHDFSEWEVVVAPTKDSAGLISRICKNNSEHSEQCELSALNFSDYNVEIVLNATCEYEGYLKYKIIVFDQLFEFEEVIPSIGHKYSSWELIETPTLESAGLLTKTCSIDNSHVVEHELPALNQYDYVYSLVKAAICEEDGLETYAITVDDQAFTFEVVLNAIDHNYGEWELIEAPTLTEAGLLTKTCDNNENHVIEYTLVPLNKANYSYTLVNGPTCEEAGLEEYAITVDFQTFTFEVVLEATGHDYGSWVLTETPSLLSTGQLRKTCSNDDSHRIEHQLNTLNKDDYIYTLIFDATCETNGLEKYELTIDSQTFTFEAEIYAEGHDYGEWELIISPTIDQLGLLKKTCYNNSLHVEEYELPLLNSVDYVYTLVSGTSCDKTGLVQYTIIVDEQSFTFEVVLDVIGHNYGSWVLVETPTLTNTGLLTKTCGNDATHIVEQVLPALNKVDYTYTLENAATCEEDGLEKYEITLDKQTFTFEVVLEAISHNYGEWALTTTPTLTEKGLLTKTCANDNTHTLEYELPSLNQEDYIYTLVNAATCEEEGLEKYEITVDDQTFTFEVVLEAITHNYSEWVLTTTPTLTEKGLLTKTCANDDTHIVEVELSLLNQEDYAYTLVSGPTCEDDGLEQYVFIIEDQTFTFEVVLEAITHNYGEWALTTTPTLTEKGLLIKTCANDNTHTLEYELPSLNQEDYTYNLVNAATCEEDGLEKYEITVDDQTFTFEVVLEAITHNYSEWVLTTTPTLTEKGLLTKTCANDNIHTLEYELPSLNQEDYTYTLVNAETCEEDGLEQYEITIDDQTFTFEVVLEAIGHDYSEWVLTTTPTLTEKGLLTKTCSNDTNHIVEVELPVLSQEDYIYTLVNAPTCEEAGLETYEITVDDQTFTFEVVLEDEGHDYGDWVIDVEPTEVSVGSRSKHCSRCDSTTDVTEIPMLPYTDGLEYELNALSTEYTVVGIGTATTSTLSITPIYNGLPVTKIGVSAFLQCSQLREVIVPNSILEIEMNAFYGCNNLEKITIPFVGKSANDQTYKYFGHIFSTNGDHNQSSYSIPSSLKTVVINGGKLNNNSFTYCYSIEEIIINYPVTEIPDSIFYYCENLTTVTLADSSKLETIGMSAFYGTKLSSFVLPKSVKTLGEFAFGGCSYLSEFIFEENSELQTIGNSAFANCYSLEAIDFTPITNLTTIGGNVFYATLITSIVVPETVTSLWPSAFAGTQIAYIQLPSLYGRTLKDYFSDYSSYVKEVIVTQDTTIGQYAFYNFKKLESLTYLKIDQITKIELKAFENCESLKSFDFENATSLNTIGEDAFINCKSLNKIDLSNTSITLIPYKAFYYCSSAKSISIPNTVTKIDRYAFSYCSSATEINIPLDSMLTTIVDYAFTYCSSLKEIYIPNTVTSCGSTILANCTSLEKITVPGTCCGASLGRFFSTSSNYIHDGIKEVVITNGTELSYGFFKNCTTLEKVTLPATTKTISSHLFDNCTSLTSVIIEDGSSVEQINTNAFYGCVNLSHINLEDLTNLNQIFEYAFYNCKSLVSVTIQSKVTNIDKYAFAECSSLNYVIFAENSVLKTVKNNAFENCDLLEIHFPFGMTSVGSSVLAGNNQIEKLTISHSMYLYHYFGTNTESIPSTLKELTVDFNNKYIPNYFASNVTSLEKVIIGNKVTIIYDEAFKGCTNLRVVEFEENSILTTIRTNAFSDCTSLEGFDLPSTVTLFMDAFRNCTSLEYFNFNNANIKTINPKTFYNCSSLKSVVIPQTVTTIGSGSFEGCSSLVSLTTPVVGYGYTNDINYKTGVLGYVFGSDDNTNVPNTLKEVYVTGGTKINSNAFSGISSIEIIELPGTVTEIGKSAFKGCTSLKTFYYTGSVDNFVSIKYNDKFANPMAHASDFYIRESKDSDWDILTEVTIPTTLKIVRDYVLYNQTNLTSVTIHSAVTSIGTQSFYNCSSLTTITVPKNVSNMGKGAFEKCSSLVSMTIPYSGGTSSTAGTIGMFYLFGVEDNTLIPQSLKELTITKQNHTSGLDNCLYIEKLVFEAAVYCQAMPNCISVKEVVLPNTLTTIYTSAFENWSSLTSLYIPASVTSIVSGETFRGCDSLTEIIVDPNNTKYDSRDNCNAIIEKKTNTLITGIKTTVIPTSVVNIGNYAFNGVKGLKEITIPEGVSSIGDLGFNYCDDLEAIYISKTVTSMTASSFYGCKNVVTCVVSDENTKYDSRDNCNAIIETSSNTMIKAFNTQVIPSTVKTIGHNAYSYCGLITELHIPANVTKINDAFRYCDKLVKITVDSSNPYYDSRDNCNAIIETLSNTLIVGIHTTTIPDSVTSIGDYAYAYKLNLETMVIPTQIESIGQYAFIGCKNLRSVSFASDNQITAIAKYTFSGCSSLTSINLPDTVTTIDEYAFNKCSSLENITFPSSLTKIGQYAFCGTSLTSIVIPEGVTYIGDYAFSECRNLVLVTLPNSLITVNSHVFSNCESLENVSLGNSLISIESYAFYYCEALSNITLPETLEVIGDYAFGYTGIEQIVLPNSISSIGKYFVYGANIETIYYNGTIVEWCNVALADSHSNPMYYTDNVYFLDNNGEYVKLDTNIVLPNTVTTIGRYQFYNAKYVESIVIPKSVTSIGYNAFMSCSKLDIVYYNGTIEDWCNIAFNSSSYLVSSSTTLYMLDEEGNYVTLTEIVIPDTISSIGAYQFYYFNNITSVVIPKSVTHIGNYAFNYCSGLTDVYYNGTISDWLKITFDNSTSNPMYYATNFYILDENGEYQLLTELVIPDTVTTIGKYQFYGFECLTSVVIPNTVKTINNYAFNQSTNLTAVYYLGSSTEIKVTVSSYNQPFTNATKYYYSETEPTETGSYWHYDTDGKTILVW